MWGTSRHIHIRYLFMKDVLRRENIELKQCPMERMISDYFTKPLQESFFKKMRNIIMGFTVFLEEEHVESSIIVNNISSDEEIDPVTNNMVKTITCADLERTENKVTHIDKPSPICMDILRKRNSLVTIKF